MGCLKKVVDAEKLCHYLENGKISALIYKCISTLITVGTGKVSEAKKNNSSSITYLFFK